MKSTINSVRFPPSQGRGKFIEMVKDVRRGTGMDTGIPVSFVSPVETKNETGS